MLGLAVGFGVMADEKIDIDKLPAKVKDTIKAKFKDAEAVSAEKETEDGKTVYEIQLKEKDAKFEAKIAEDGTLIEVEKPVAIKDLPKEITDAIEAKFPKAELKTAELSTKGDKTAYEVVITTADKKKVEVVLDPKGKILETEDVKEEKKDGDKKDKEEKKDKK